MKVHYATIAVCFFLQEKAVRSIGCKAEFNGFGIIRETEAMHVMYLMSIFGALDGRVKKIQD